MLEAMEEHARCEAVQSEGLGSIYTLTFNNDGQEGLAAGIPLVLQAMSAFEDNEVQMRACMALSNLCGLWEARTHQPPAAWASSSRRVPVPCRTGARSLRSTSLARSQPR